MVVIKPQENCLTTRALLPLTTVHSVTHSNRRLHNYVVCCENIKVFMGKGFYNDLTLKLKLLWFKYRPSKWICSQLLLEVLTFFPQYIKISCFIAHCGHPRFFVANLSDQPVAMVTHLVSVMLGWAQRKVDILKKLSFNVLTIGDKKYLRS